MKQGQACTSVSLIEVEYQGERTPDDIRSIPIGGDRVIAYAFGSGSEPVLCVSGGPGMSCDYVRDGHTRLADAGFRLIAYDQRGTGASSRPDQLCCTFDSYVDEIDRVRQGFDLPRVHLLGQSWGVWLAIEYALSHPERVASLVLANGCADIPAHMLEMKRLQAALGLKAAGMMSAHEAAGTTDHPAYLAALHILDQRHICRLPVWPAPLDRSVATTNWPLYRALWGVNDYVCTGPLRSWTRLADLHRIRHPTLVIHGDHDEFTPDDARRMSEALPHATLAILTDCSHTPFFEQPEAYFAALTAFLRQNPISLG